MASYKNILVATAIAFVHPATSTKPTDPGESVHYSADVAYACKDGNLIGGVVAVTPDQKERVPNFIISLDNPAKPNVLLAGSLPKDRVEKTRIMQAIGDIVVDSVVRGMEACASTPAPPAPTPVRPNGLTDALWRIDITGGKPLPPTYRL